MSFDQSYHDEETMQKVYNGLINAGLEGQEIIDAIDSIMNQGIVFREPRPPVPVRPDPVTAGYLYADEVSFSEFIRLLKGAHGDAWAVLPDAGRLLLITPEREYKSKHPEMCRQVEFTMFIVTVMRIMEERGKPWIDMK